MRNILIGSRALNYWYPDMKINFDTDWDIISNRQIDFDDPIHFKIEWHDAWLLNNEEFERYTDKNYTLDILGQKVYICNPVGLSIIKRSHLWRNIKFDKHITHYHKYLKKHSTHYDDIDKLLLKQRIRMTMEKYPQGNPNLMQSKEDFFNDAVVKKYDHDYLHELFAYHDKPLYTRLLRQADLAWCDEDKWLSLSHEDKLRCAAEEVQVIATERFLIPNNWKCSSKLSYNKALGKLCTTLCSGWFRDFGIDYYPELINMYDKSRFDKVQSILNAKE